MDDDKTLELLIGACGAAMLFLIGWIRQAGAEKIGQIREQIKEINRKLDKDQLEQKHTRHKHVDMISENKSMIQLLTMKIEDKVGQIDATLEQHRGLLRTGLRMINQKIKDDEK